ncbi:MULTISPECIES: DUF2516 family protein [Corynebacterium]|uniref:DUF2516 family protein n=1 Tax=Corynebacterium kefirresidentii TaxID=1979527 RepID=A0ABT8Q656_9CORY|nr:MULTISPECIES: DUF2516 family protein [Corynebacterium]MDN8620774.1 DUF2516 family protein [Corynebacterium kefirresidentii]MDN8642494.1 DUF2516 family protein [Corynebacterium kefirresidentii]MDU4570177.1 DUF2516 family protein [Corynebacterium sp.]MDU6012859.1 DUF2516 family protein [Corynebacterium sp.]MDV2414608.1 DUF2516 family protein [Corynebacterium kefirresidentii]
MNSLFEIAYSLDAYILRILALTAIIGAVLAATTREDAFRAGDRQGKWVWVGLLAGSAVAMATGMPFLSWIGAVITGVYWFDVRPQLKAIINGDYSY